MNLIRINLLPHREDARKKRRQQFNTSVALVLLLAAAVGFAGWFLIDQQLSGQRATNQFLKDKITVLEKQNEEIKQIKEETQALLARKQIIETLQSNRAETVHIFNELIRRVPEGVVIKKLKQDSLKINLVGYAQSNARVSQLMRNLEDSPALEKPQLIEIKAVDFNHRRVMQFNLNITIERDTESAANMAKEGPKKQRTFNA